MSKTISLKKSKGKDKYNVIKLVRKSNELVEARYKFDIWETRIFTKMLTMVRRDDLDFCSYKIYLSDLVKDFGLENNKDAYERLRAGGFKLMRKIIKVVRNTNEGLMELSTPIIIGLENPVNYDKDDAKFINVSFHPDMKPFLLSLQSQFTTYDVRNILKLPSSYSIRIYELLKQYQKIGQRKFVLQELKEIIGVIEEIDVNGKKTIKDNYPLYGNFRQRVLLKAQRDLKKFTDISFEFEQIKKGRAVQEIVFFISLNEPVQKPIVASKKAAPKSKTKEHDESLVVEIHKIVEEWVSKSVVRKWVKAYPEIQIRNAVNYTLNQLKSGKDIPNVGGYLQTMVKEEKILDINELKREKAIQKKKKQKSDKQTKKNLEASLKMLYLDLMKEEEELIEKIFANNPQAESQVLEAVKSSRFSNFNKKLSLEENLKNQMFKASFRNTVKMLFPLQFEQLQQHYLPQVDSLKLAISKL